MATDQKINQETELSSLQHLIGIVTSYTREVSSHKALNAGFNRFIVKLESPEEIVGEIVQLLSLDINSRSSSHF